MLTASEKRHVSSSSGGSQGFTIKAGAKAFQILRDSLYSRKEEAICRETFTNAYDAHLMVGKGDVPFDVTFPSVFDSTFRVRDYGPGMDHDFMLGDYTVAFHSTKDQTNSQVGGFGLGRMSAFSYTDTYSVTVWQKGKKRFYSLLIGEDGVPECHFLGEQDSDEPSGTEVSFPIKRHDVKAFAEAMRRVSIGFDVKPNAGSHGNPWWDVEPTFNKGWYRVYKGERSHYSNSGPLSDQYYAKMGCVLYPMNMPIGVRPDIGLNSSDVLVVDFPIGSLAVSASREELSYGDKEPTNATIRDYISRLNTEFKQDILNQIAASGSYQEALKLYYEFHIILPQAHWCGQELDTTYRFHGRLPVALEHHYNWSNRSKRMFRSDDEVLGNFKTGDRRVAPLDIALVYILDQSEKIVRAKDRMTEHFNSLKLFGGAILYVKFDPTNKDHQDSLQDFMSKFPDVTYVNVADLPDPGPAVKGSSGPIKVKKLKQHKHPFYFRTEYLTDIDLSDAEFKAGGIYVRTLRSESEESVSFLGRTKTLCLENIDSLWGHYMSSKNVTQEYPIAVPKTIQKRFDEAPQWRTLSDAWQEWFAEVLNQACFKHVVKELDFDTKQKVAYMGFVEELSKLSDLLNKAKSKSITKRDQFLGSMLYSTLLPRVNRLDRMLEGKLKAVYTKYPLLKHYQEESREDFEDYYNLMKEKKHERV